MAALPSLACSIQQRIGVQWKQHNYSDVTVVVEGTSFQCHKLILGACSEFFQGLFRTQMKENQDGRVELHEVAKDTFSLILDLIYTGIDGLTVENILDVWSGCDHLNIDYLITHCENFVMRSMTIDNCFIFYSHALKHSSNRVKSCFFDYARIHFENIKDCQWFFELSVDEVIQIVESDILAAKSEDSVAESVLKWLEHIPQATVSQEAIEVEDRSEHVTKLLSVVRLYLVSPACLRSLSQYKCVLSCEKAHEMIIGAIYYVLCLENRHDSGPAQGIHRLTSQTKNASVFVNDRSVMIYNLDTGTLRQHSQSPFPWTAALTVFDNVLYMCDGDTSLRMYTHDKSWETVFECTTGKVRYRYTMLLLSHKEYIYCVDNRACQLKRYNCAHGHKKQWTPYISVYINIESLVRFQQYILLFSTIDDTVSMQCLDTTKLGFIQIYPENPIEGTSADMVSFSDSLGDVFIIQRSGQLWKIVSTDSSPVDFCKVSLLWSCDCEICDCKIYGAVISRHKLIVFVNSSFAQLHKNPDCAKHVDGLCEEIQFVEITSDTKCLPILVDNEIFTSTTKS